MYQRIQAIVKAPIRGLVMRAFYWQLLMTSQRLQPTTKSAMIFAPHQDDESFGCGSLIALKRVQGVPVRVVFLTDGGKSYGWDRMPPGDLAERRQQEALAALAALGVGAEAVTFLNHPDGELDRLSQEDHQALVEKLTYLLGEFEPEEVYVTYRRDAHADHEAASQLVQAAIRQVGRPVHLLEYPIWSLYQPQQLNFAAPEFKSLYRLPIQAHQAQKLAAIACHRSQYEPIPPDTQGGLPRFFLERLSSPNEFFFSYPWSNSQGPVP